MKISHMQWSRNFTKLIRNGVKIQDESADVKKSLKVYNLNNNALFKQRFLNNKVNT